MKDHRTEKPARVLSGYRALRDEYAGLARRYDRRWARYTGHVVGEMLRWLELEPDARLLDVGCGTGALLKAISTEGPGPALVGVDLSPEMLARAQGRLGARVFLAAAAAEALPLVDDSFDVVASGSVFHFVRQPDKAIGEFNRVLKPGGRLVITDWSRDFLSGRLMHRWLAWTNSGHYRMYTAEELSTLITDGGFEIRDNRFHRASPVWGLMTIVAKKV